MTTSEPRTLISFILDESASMGSCWQAAISSFNEYIADRRKEPNTYITLTTFNTAGRKVRYTAKPAVDVEDLTDKTYIPAANTPLYDAVAETIRETEKADQQDDVLVVILTDGEENSSVEIRSAEVLKKIIEAKTKEGWTFAYVGSVQDPWAVAGAMGIANAVAYAPTAAGTSSAMAGLSTATSNWAGSNVMRRASGGPRLMASASVFDGHTSIDDVVANPVPPIAPSSVGSSKPKKETLREWANRK